MHNSFVIYRYFICVCAINFVFSGKIDENEIKTWVSKFEQNLQGHINKVLAVDQIENNFKNYNKDLVIAKINGSAVFSSIYERVSLRYTDLELAVKAIKSAFEGSVSPSSAPPGPSTPGPAAPPGLVAPPGFPAPPGLKPLVGPGAPSGGPRVPLARCCTGVANTYPYKGRFRDGVDMKECYENVDDTLRLVADSGATEVFQKNIEKYSSVAWQYFADDAGHFIQYPTNGRLCDKTSRNISSPLVQELFVEKLHMERKNLVILLDNGRGTSKIAALGKPAIKRQLMKDAVLRSLTTLTDNDKLNVVVSPSTNQATEVLGQCSQRLYVASEANKDRLIGLINSLPLGKGEASLQQGLSRAYQLLEEDKNRSAGRFEQRSNIVLIVLDGDGKPFDKEKTPILEMIAREQKNLNHSVQHFIYILGNPSDKEFIERVAQVADQNNLKLNSSSGVIPIPWPAIPGLVSNGTVVGREGILDIVKDPEMLPSRVSSYFQRLPAQVDKELTLIAPVLDSKLGASMTLALPVYKRRSKQVLGVAAVDASLATVFSEVANFDIGENSYAFLFETNNGKVLLHPKLRDPDEAQSKDTVFPTLEVIEPYLNSTQIQALHTASAKMQHFDAKVHNIEVLLSGETSLNRETLPATVYYQLIAGTRLCVAVVHLHIDGEEARKQSDQEEADLDAPYHRIDRLYGSPEKNVAGEVCALEKHYVSFKDSVIKLSPSVFKDPERYKYTEEQITNITAINQFLMKQGPKGADPVDIKADLRSLIQFTVRSTQSLDSLWTNTAKDVIERFYGTPTGVFRMYPGIPLPNTHDHLKSEWYMRSLTFPNQTVYHRGRLSWANKQDVIIVSRALIDYSGYGRLEGVVGMTVSPRFLSSLLLKGATDCYKKDKICHIVDDKGIIIDSFLEKTKDRHITTVYPWLADRLRKEGKMKVNWCTGFSDGYHKMTFFLDQVQSSDTTNTDQCLQYKLEYIPRTNIHLLVLNDRDIGGCNDVALQACSCHIATYNPYYQFHLPRCEYCYDELVDQCQCKCFCDSDFEQCEDTYNFNRTNFPNKACFYKQIEPNEPELLPEPPRPGIQHCPLPCVAIEDMDVCSNLGHCKVSGDIYPTCIWKDDNEYNSSEISFFFPTKGPPTPPPLITATTGKVEPVTGPPPTAGSSPGPPPTAGNSPGPPIMTPLTISTSPKAPPGLLSSTGMSTGAKTNSVIVSGAVTKPSSSPAEIMSTHTSGLQSSTLSSVSTTSTQISTAATGRHENLVNKSENEGDGLSGGAIAAIVIAVLAVALISAFVAIKLYGKKFRRPQADDSSKYRPGSSMFDSTLFNSSREQVTIGPAPSSTIPYQEM